MTKPRYASSEPKRAGVPPLGMVESVAGFDMERFVEINRDDKGGDMVRKNLFSPCRLLLVARVRVCEPAAKTGTKLECFSDSNADDRPFCCFSQPASNCQP